MANKTISALTGATTPLAGTETLPVVQGGVTVKATVANVTGSGLYPGSFTTLASTGNTILGDASTDTVMVNGYMGVGGAASANSTITTTGQSLTGTSQYGVAVTTKFNSASTVKSASVLALPTTTASAWTSPLLAGFYAADASKGAGSTITNQHGLYIVDQTQGTNNYGITSLVTSGTNKWNIYVSGTADNYAAGNWKFAAAKGINFTANTPAAGMSSQLLNWYEEGTWTPTFSADGGSFTTVSGTGKYTRVGRLVVAQFTLTFTTLGTAAGAAYFTLPFTNGNMVSEGVARRTTGGGDLWQIVALTNNSSAALYSYINGNIGAMANGNVFNGTISYMV